MKKSGFTFVEIAIVTSIIGLLVAMSSLAIMKSIRNSRIKNAEVEVEILSAAVLQLAWDTGKWPNGAPLTAAGSTEEWDLSKDKCGLFVNDGTYNNWKGPYYEGALEDPWENPYFFDPDYSYMSETRIMVGSFGPNGVGPNQYDGDDVKVWLDD